MFTTYASVIGLSFFFYGPAFAISDIDGVIDANYKYAWGQKLGWVNFGATNGGVVVSDGQLTGYVWSEHYGWINLNPANGGVTNNAYGELSGSAWGEKVGWIDFSNASISTLGQFAGYAEGGIAGRISFDCSGCVVRTDWLPQNVRPLPTSGGGGGGGPPGGVAPPAPIDNSASYVLINHGAEETDNASVLLRFRAGSEVKVAEISNYPDFKEAEVMLFNTERSWQLLKESGLRTVYVRFYNEEGDLLVSVSDNILLKNDENQPEIPNGDVDEDDGYGGVVSRVKDIIEGVADFIAGEEDKETAVKEKSSLIVNALPEKMKQLITKFPDLVQSLYLAGIRGLSDLGEIAFRSFRLPTISELVSSENKLTELPQEIIFIQSSDGLLDVAAGVVFNGDGSYRLQANLVKGKAFRLFIRPEGPVRQIKAYLTLAQGRALAFMGSEGGLKTLKASLLETSFEYLAGTQTTEDKLVVAEFDFRDIDGDGVYEAEILAPQVTGEYEVLSYIDYEDENRGVREIRLTTVVDPEGYVYEVINNREARVEGARVTLYARNKESNDFEIWDAERYSQSNPQVTDKSGNYAFLVPAGEYYLVAESSEHKSYKSKVFDVEHGRSVHENIELESFNKTIVLPYIKLVMIMGVLLGITAILFMYLAVRKRRSKTAEFL